jgi:hypothetical protein
MTQPAIAGRRTFQGLGTGRGTRFTLGPFPFTYLDLPDDTTVFNVATVAPGLVLHDILLVVDVAWNNAAILLFSDDAAGSINFGTASLDLTVVDGAANPSATGSQTMRTQFGASVAVSSDVTGAYNGDYYLPAMLGTGEVWLSAPPALGTATTGSANLWLDLSSPIAP